MNIRVIIVDDEALGRQRMRMLLEEFSGVTICAECEGGVQAVEAIQEHTPDLVLLDIRMPDLDGFGVIAELRACGVTPPVVIFVTAYNEHAIDAFEVNAIDYLLKPVQAERLEVALERVSTMLSSKNPEDWQSKLTELLAATQPKQFLNRIEIRSQGRTDYVDVEDVTWLKADRNYIEVFTTAKTYLARMTLADLERQLDPNTFMRISRSAMVNLTCVKGIQTEGRRGHEILLRDGSKVPLKRTLEEVQNRLKFAK